MNDKIIRLVLVDDHQIVRDGIRALLQEEKRVEICGEAANGDQLQSFISCCHPDMILMDISLPDISGIELTRKVTLENPEIKVIMLSMYVNEDFIFNALNAGAHSYLPKNITRAELLEAIIKVSKGEEYFPEEVSAIMLKSYVRKAQNPKNEELKPEPLTKRENEILKMTAEGLSNQEMADQLHISIRTVESHKNHIMQKLELKSTTELIKYAIRNNIIRL